MSCFWLIYAIFFPLHLTIWRTVVYQEISKGWGSCRVCGFFFSWILTILTPQKPFYHRILASLNQILMWKFNFLLPFKIYFIFHCHFFNDRGFNPFAFPLIYQFWKKQWWLVLFLVEELASSEISLIDLLVSSMQAMV